MTRFHTSEVLIYTKSAVPAACRLENHIDYRAKKFLLRSMTGFPPGLTDMLGAVAAFRYLLVFTVARRNSTGVTPYEGAECRWYLENGTR